MYERAIDELSHAVELAPSLDTARLQLGMLCLTCGMSERGIGELRPLTACDEDNCCHHFASALIALAEDRAADSMAALEAGLALPAVNQALMEDMGRLLHTVRQQLQPDAPHPASAPADAPNPQSLWLSSYRKNGTHSQ